MVSPRNHAVSLRLDSLPMVKDPRPHKPGSPEPDEALDLLRALARSKGSRSSPRPSPPRLPPGGGEEKLDSLKALAERLDSQLRSPAQGAPGDPGHHPLTAPSDTPFGIPPPRRAELALGLAEGKTRGRDPDLPRDRATLMPRFGAQRIIFVVLSVAVLVVAAVGGVMRHRAPPGQVSAPQVVPPNQIVPPTQVPQVAPQQALPPAQPIPSVTDTPPQPATAADIDAIRKSMSDCDDEARKNPDSLLFFILPVTTANPADDSWRKDALQTVGGDVLLLSASATVDGLRDHRLYLRSGRYTFAVLDTGSGATYSWTSATGMTRLSKSKVGSIKSLRLGFDFSVAQAGPQWSADFKRDVGACYWVSALVRQ